MCPVMAAYCRSKNASKSIAREEAVVVRIDLVKLLLQLSPLGRIREHAGVPESTPILTPMRCKRTPQRREPTSPTTESQYGILTMNKTSSILIEIGRASCRE